MTQKWNGNEIEIKQKLYETEIKQKRNRNELEMIQK